MQALLQNIFTLLPGLETYKTVDLGLNVTPIDKLPRLGDKLGINLLAKRDDTTTLAMGGNKVRQLEYYLGPAKQHGADTILITGAVQSNFTRLCAAASRKLGWNVVVQLEERVPKASIAYNRSGNVLLNQLLGAEMHYFPEGENEAAADANLDRLADNLRNQNRSPYVIHLGIDHPPLGGLGYAYCAAECFLQLQGMKQQVNHVVIPSGSGLTHAGFLSGANAIGWDVNVQGICVRRDAVSQYNRIRQRATEIDTLLDSPAVVSDSQIQIDDAVLNPGYGQLNAPVKSAIDNAAQLEALLLDPVYSGRTMAGLISLVERGVIQKGETVLFVHTGGLPAIFAYQEELAND